MYAQTSLRFVMCLLAGGVVASCGGGSSPGECAGPSDCDAGAMCIDGMCSMLDSGAVDASADAGLDARVDSAVDSGADAAPPVTGARCGDSASCPAGTVCREGACHLDCAGAPFCGSPEVCCGATEVCAGGACVAPGAVCDPAPGCSGAGAVACPEGAYCDAALMRCLPSPDSVACTLPAPPPEFAPELMWSWSGSVDHPDYKGVLTTPMVADLDHDGASDVIVVAYADPPASFGGTISGFGILCALSGAGDCAGGAREIFCTDPADTEHLLNSWGHPAVGDLDSTDGVDELTIVASLHRTADGARGVVAFDERGAVKWVGHDASGATVDAFYYGGAATLADLDGDGHVEVIVGSRVFGDDGLLRWSAPTERTGNARFGPIAIAVDLDADADLEVVTGGAAYDADGPLLWDNPSVGGGYPAAADFDGDGLPELVVVSAGAVHILNRDGSAFAPAMAFSSLRVGGAVVTGRGGAPTVADIDGDGRPDIGVATANAYVALRVTAAPVIEQMWAQPANDASSNITASAMFDFDGNGVSEVIYQDTCNARVYSGADGSVLMDIDNVSGTASNYPTVADLDGDTRAEFILVADSYYARAFPATALGCPASTPLIDGVRVYRDANDGWQATRGIWNEHAYHVTNVCDGVDMACPAAENRAGAIPRREVSASSASFNAYRVNARLGAVAHPAPDLLVVALGADLSECPAFATLRADVVNRGSQAVPAGVSVAFYEGSPSGPSSLLGTALLDRALPAGGVIRVTLRVARDAAAADSVAIYAVADDDGSGMGAYRECDEANNLLGPETFNCAGLL